MNYRPSTRPGYDGWALQIWGSTRLLPWSLCRTREECRALLRERGGLFERVGAEARPVKVRIRMEVCE